MYRQDTRASALNLMATGLTLSAVSRLTGVSRSSLREWRAHPDPLRRAANRDCFRCAGSDVDPSAYAALLGFYLGDGCLSAAARYFAFRVSCDPRHPGIVADVRDLMLRMRPGRQVFLINAPAAVVVQSNWTHWPCLFPQHGPGRKHERPIRLDPWQEAIVEARPAEFLRGLSHSDGCRAANWATATVGGERRRYDYPRWEFVNSSDDIIDLCTQAVDLIGLRWRRPRVNCITVSRRVDVRRLDELIGPKR